MSRLPLAAILVSFLGAGCASSNPKGMKATDHLYWTMHDGPAYAAPKCTNAATGAATDGTSSMYFVVDDGGRPALDQRDPDDISESIITNRWSADDGDHYFYWTGDRGVEVVIPKGEGGVKRVYDGVTVAEAAGVTKPTSAVTLNCPLIPYKE